MEKVTKKQAEEIRDAAQLRRWDNYQRVQVIECGCDKVPHAGKIGRSATRYDRTKGEYIGVVVWDFDFYRSSDVPKANDPGACTSVRKFRVLETTPANYPQAKLGDVIRPTLIGEGEPGHGGLAVVAHTSTLKERNGFVVRAYQIEKDAKGRFEELNWFYVYEWEVVDGREYIEAKEKADAAAQKEKERAATARKHQRHAQERMVAAMKAQQAAEAERDAMAALVEKLRENPEHLIEFHADRVEKVTLIDGDETGAEHVYEAAALRLTPWEEK